MEYKNRANKAQFNKNRIAKKLNKSIMQLNHDIFIMFNQVEIKLTKVPVNVHKT
jgi:hypothetical protein